MNKKKGRGCQQNVAEWGKGGEKAMRVGKGKGRKALTAMKAMKVGKGNRVTGAIRLRDRLDTLSEEEVTQPKQLLLLG